MSTISAGTTTPTALSLSGDTTGALTFQVNGTTTAATITAAGNVGIGTSTPAAPLTIASVSGTAAASLIQGEVNNERFQIRSAVGSTGLAGGTAVVSTFGSRGTIASPSASLSGDQLGYYQLGGYDGTNWVRSAWITGLAAENYSATNRGSHLTFATTPIGSTAIAERMRIDSSGNVGIGTASPDAKLTVSGGAASFADGTSSAPAIANAGDLDTGVYFPAANEVAVTTGGTVAAAFNSNGLFFRNRIINGDMRIDQRNAGASGTSQAPGYPVDRWAYSSSQTSKLTWQQNAGSVTPPAGFTNYLGVTSSSAYTLTGNDYFQIYQVIEGNNVADLAWGTADARPATLSFWVRSSLTGTFGGSLATTKTAVWTLPFTYTISSANTWTYVTVAIPAATSTGGVNTDNSAGIFVRFGLGSAGTSAGGTAGTWVQANYIQPASTVSVVSTNAATWYITGVQLETGSVATPFERRPYGTELMLCQRYCQKLAGDTAYTVVVQGSQSSTTGGVFTYNFGNPMRASPTATFGTIADFYARNYAIISNLVTFTLDTGVSSTKETASFLATWGGAGAAAGDGIQIVSGLNAPKVILSAEL